MRKRTHSPSSRWYRYAIVIACALSVTPTATPGKDMVESFPDCVCYPVNGTGYIVSHSSELGAHRVPASTLSPLEEGDSLVVESGTITVLDFRDGHSQVLGKGTIYRVPAVWNRERPTWWEELKERLGRILQGPGLHRVDPGATRDVPAALWPDDDVEFAPDVPIVFKWWGVSDTLSAIRILAGDQQTDLPLPDPTSDSGGLAWDLIEKPTGSVEWQLLDAYGEPYLIGRFHILTPQQADEKREIYRAQARGDVTPQELAAILRALADRSYLW